MGVWASAVVAYAPPLPFGHFPVNGGNPASLPHSPSAGTPSQSPPGRGREGCQGRGDAGASRPLWMGVPSAEASAFVGMTGPRGGLRFGLVVVGGSRLGGHPPLASLRSLAPPYASRRGRSPSPPDRGRGL